MTEAASFSVFNVAIGFVISWLISHYTLPILFDVERSAKRSTAITAVYTVAALIRNVGVYALWTM